MHTKIIVLIPDTFLNPFYLFYLNIYLCGYLFSNNVFTYIYARAKLSCTTIPLRKQYARKCLLVYVKFVETRKFIICVWQRKCGVIYEIFEHKLALYDFNIKLKI